MLVEKLVENFGAIIGATIIAFFPYVVEAYKKNSKIWFGHFRRNVNTREKMNVLLHDMLIKFTAQSIRVYSYHNGDYSKSGIPFDYVSMVFEKTDRNTLEIMHSFQKMPISIFNDTLFSIMHSTTVGFLCHSVRSVEGEQRQQLLAYGCDTCYHFILTNDIKDGVVSLNFSKEKNMTQEDIDYIKWQLKEFYILQRKLK